MVINIGKQIDLLTGFPFPSKGYASSGIRLLRGSNIKRGSTDWNEVITQYWEKVTPELKKYILNEGDIVVAMDGSLVGRSFARLTKSDLPALLLQRVARIRSDKIEVAYLKEFVCSKHFTEHCDSVKTVTAIPHISPKDIREFKIPKPPTKTEQTAIANALTDADALIQSLARLIAKKRQIKQGTMEILLNPYENGSLKAGWVVKKLGDCLVASPDYGINAPAVQFSLVLPKYIRITDISENGKYLKENCASVNHPRSQDYVLQNDDLVFARTGASVGKSYLYDAKDGELVFAGFLIRVKLDKEKLNSKYLKYYTQTKRYWDWVIVNSMRSGQPGINGSEYSSLPVPIPNDIKEQARIANILSGMDADIAALETKLAKTQHVKQGMMQNLLTGRIRLI